MPRRVSYPLAVLQSSKFWLTRRTECHVPSGQRKVIKVPNPNTLVQNIVVDAAQQFNVNPAQAYLQHKRTVLDKSQPFRFCGLSNNAQVDLVVAATSGSQKAKPCKIALAIEGHDNIMENIDSSLTLLEMLEYLVSIGKVPSGVFEMGPEIVYLRASYKGDEDLRNATLAGLGLAGQSARLQLRFGGGAVTPTGASPRITSATSVSSVSSVSTSAPTPAPAELINSLARGAPAVDNSGPEHQTAVEAAEPVPGAMEVAEQAEVPLSPPPSPNTLSLSTARQQQQQSGGSEAAPALCGSGAAAANTGTPPPMAPAEALRDMLSSNFDASSVPAVITLAKYIMNVLLSPQDQRFQRINTLNKVFVTKVQPATGATQFLYSVGFRPATEDPGTLLLATADGALSAAQLSRLEQGWVALQAAMQELDVPLIERPAGPEVTAAALRAERGARAQAQVQLERQVAFDPFRAHIVRAAPQPPREDGTGARNPQAGLSATETQLLELQRKRALLEGDPASVARCTEVVLPFSGAGGSSSGKSGSGAAMEVVGEDDPSATGGPVPRSVLQKILKHGGEGDETPLTTAAVRELQRAQKERVYDRTLIKVKFPDRLQLQGYFHPRHTAQDVHDWVAQCLSPAVHQASFELYTTPPRTVLAPLPAPVPCKHGSRGTGTNSSSQGRGWDGDGGEAGGGPTLSDLKLVPAASVFLAWRAPAGAEALSSPERYLDPQLFETAMARAEGQHGPSASAGSVAYPVGQQLVQQPQQRPAEEAQGKSGARGSGRDPSSTNGKGERKAFKPKWFK